MVADPSVRRHHFDLDSGRPSSTFCSLLRPRDVFGRRGHRLISVVEMRPWWSLRPRSSRTFVVRSSLSGGVVRVAEPCARTPASPSPFWEGALACHLESALRLGDERRVPPFAGAASAPKGSEKTHRAAYSWLVVGALASRCGLRGARRAWRCARPRSRCGWRMRRCGCPAA